MPRRIVTGYRAGKSVIVADNVPVGPTYRHSMGFSNVEFWSTPAVPPHPGPSIQAEPTGRLPGPGESQLLIVTFPPDAHFASPDFNPALAATEQARLMPGIAACFDPDNPGMHRTPTVDYVIVLEGELVLELDDGESRTIGSGDIVVQNGTRHAWRNPGDRPAVNAVILVGDVQATTGFSPGHSTMST